MICGNVMSGDHFSHIRNEENKKYSELFDYLNNNYNYFSIDECVIKQSDLYLSLSDFSLNI